MLGGKHGEYVAIAFDVGGNRSRSRQEDLMENHVAEEKDLTCLYSH